MNNGRYRVLLVCANPVQYVTPLFRRMAHHPKLEILVAYSSLRGAEPSVDPGFGVKVAWDVPVLDAYPWVSFNDKPGKNGQQPSSLFNRQLWNLVRAGNFDAVYVGGYYFKDAWVAMLAAKRARVPLLFSTDAHSLESWKVKSKLRQSLKKVALRRIYGMARMVMAGSSGTVAFLKSLGVPEERILLARNVVDNAWWTNQAEQADRAVVRASWNTPQDATVLLYCAKLQPWKRPLDALQAFARADAVGSYLVFAGDGPLRENIERQAHELGVSERVRMLGFVNQSRLPGVYRASDLLILPSEYEPFGLVVNEAMLCGCAAVVSDQVGAKFDLVCDGETGFVYPCHDVDALATLLRDLLRHSERLKKIGVAARERMAAWTPEQNVAAFAQAVEEAVRSRL